MFKSYAYYELGSGRVTNFKKWSSERSEIIPFNEENPLSSATEVYTNTALSALARDQPQVEHHGEAEGTQPKQREYRRDVKLEVQGAARSDSHSDSGSTPKFTPSGVTHPLANQS